MSYFSLLNHTCDIYHIQQVDASPGYGLKASPKFDYPEEADEKEIPCHFGVHSGSREIVQTAPKAEYIARIKLALPQGTDIRLNDKIIDNQTGYEYTADIPVQIRAHHVYAMVSRKTAEKPV